MTYYYDQQELPKVMVNKLEHYFGDSIRLKQFMVHVDKDTGMVLSKDVLFLASFISDYTLRNELIQIFIDQDSYYEDYKNKTDGIGQYYV